MLLEFEYITTTITSTTTAVHHQPGHDSKCTHDVRKSLLITVDFTVTEKFSLCQAAQLPTAVLIRNQYHVVNVNNFKITGANSWISENVQLLVLR